jgi:hypothetical protein
MGKHTLEAFREGVDHSFSHASFHVTCNRTLHSTTSEFTLSIHGKRPIQL